MAETLREKGFRVAEGTVKPWWEVRLNRVGEERTRQAVMLVGKQGLSVGELLYALDA